MNAPPISVVMAVFNGRAYLRRAVESILAQSFSQFEFIIVDDGSTDGSERLLARYARADQRVKVLRCSHRGLTPSLNEGIYAARGEFVARFDADDVSALNRFEVQNAFLERRESVIAVGSHIRLIDPSGAEICVQQFQRDHEDIVDELATGSAALAHPSVMMRRQAVLSVGGYREIFRTAQDVDLWLRLSDLGCLANIQKPLLDYRLHLRQLSNTRREEQRAFASQAATEWKLQHGLIGVDAQVPHVGTRSVGPASTRRTWAAMALKAGNSRTALKHALGSVMQSPVSLASWYLLIASTLSVAVSGNDSKSGWSSGRESSQV